MKIKGVHRAKKLKAYLFLPLAIFLLCPAIVSGAQTNRGCAQRGRGPMMHHQIWEGHHAMMKLERQMKANDQRLNHLVSKMKNAKGKRKIDAIAAVVNAMVQQREQMQHMMIRLHHRMMWHMRMDRRGWNGKPWQSRLKMKHRMGGANAPADG